MNRTILSLIIFGVALAILHVPYMVLAISIIGGLSVIAIKLIWTVLQGFSQSSQPTMRSS